jgi:glutamate synthase domain-containing protein 2
MGISTLQSYQGAQIFEILGLNKSVVDKYFTGATSRIEGMGLDEIAKEALAKHHFSFSKKNNQLNVYQLEEFINGNEKVNSIYSIHKPFIYCNILQKRMIMQHLKNIQSCKRSK